MPTTTSLIRRPICRSLMARFATIDPVTAGRELVAVEADGSAAVPVHLLVIEHADGDLLSTGPVTRRIGAANRARSTRPVFRTKRAYGSGRKERQSASSPATFMCSRPPTKRRSRFRRPCAMRRCHSLFTNKMGCFKPTRPCDSRSTRGDRRPGRRRQTRSRLDHPFLRRSAGALPDLDEVPDSNPLIKRLRDWNELAGKHQFETLFTTILDESGIIRRERFLKDDERASDQLPAHLRGPARRGSYRRS